MWLYWYIGWVTRGGAECKDFPLSLKPEKVLQKRVNFIRVEEIKNFHKYLSKHILKIKFRNLYQKFHKIIKIFNSFIVFALTCKDFAKYPWISGKFLWWFRKFCFLELYCTQRYVHAFSRYFTGVFYFFENYLRSYFIFLIVSRLLIRL